MVDDGSRDETAVLIKNKFPEVHYIYQEQKGVSAARNRGIEEASCPWISFLDSDDEWKPQKIERQISALEKTHKRICHTNEIWIKNGRQINQKKKHRKKGGYIYSHCLPMCRISPSSVIIHQKIFDKVGRFDELLPVCEDYDLWLRICARYSVCFVDEPLIIKYGGHEDQLSQKYWGMDRFRIYALEKMIESGHLDHKQNKETARELIKKLKIYRIGAEKRGKYEEVEETDQKIEHFKTYLK